ncbi:MAG: ABC transporter substrate-binding protein [Treponema sp.]|jgi:NitT/TauT family transport system substrate-binding protein|nr:ABC transporter substrate-binding protein [Treponema sp.]
MKKFLLLALAALSLGAACKKKENAAYPLGEYQLEYAGSTCGSPTSIGLLKGFFAEEGLGIELVSGNTFEASRALLQSGKIPVTNGDFQYFPSIHEGIDVKLIGGLHEGCIKVLVPVNSPINDFADFRGKRIAVDEIGGTPMSVVSVAAGSAGITDPQNEITWLPFPNDQIRQAAEKGEVDIIAQWDPFATTLEQSGEYRVILDIATHPLFKDKACCFLFASGKLVKERPDVVAAVLRGYHKSVKWIGEHPREAAELLISEKKVATEELDLVAGLLEHYNYGAHSGPQENARAKEDAIYFADWLTKIGYLPKDLDAQKFIDDIYVDIFALEAQAKK